MGILMTVCCFEAEMCHGILDGLTSEGETLVEICEDRAISEMRGYMSARYDVDELFSAEGTARNQLVLMMAIDIAVYHLFSIHNPQKISQIRKDRYERAVEWLKQIAAFKISVDGATSLPEETVKNNSPMRMSSNPKRTNHL